MVHKVDDRSSYSGSDGVNSSTPVGKKQQTTFDKVINYIKSGFENFSKSSERSSGRERSYSLPSIKNNSDAPQIVRSRSLSSASGANPDVQASKVSALHDKFEAAQKETPVNIPKLLKLCKEVRELRSTLGDKSGQYDPIYQRLYGKIDGSTTKERMGNLKKLEDLLLGIQSNEQIIKTMPNIKAELYQQTADFRKELWGAIFQVQIDLSLLK